MLKWLTDWLYRWRAERRFSECAALGPWPPIYCTGEPGHKGLHHAPDPNGGHFWWRDGEYRNDPDWKAVWKRELYAPARGRWKP